MKKKVIACLAVALLTTLGAIQTKAQYLPASLESSRGYLIDQNGDRLSDQDVLLAVGEEIYHDTYEGARKQYKVGDRLLKGGIIGVAAGTAVTLSSAVLLATGQVVVDQQSRQVTGMDMSAAMGILGIYTGVTVVALSAVVLEAGIPFKIIGSRRLNWVAENYNENQRSGNVSLRFGAGRYGTGLVLSF